MTPIVRWKNFTLENFKEVLGYYKDEYKGKNWKEVEDLIDSENGAYKRTSYQFCGQLGLEYKEGREKKNLFKIQDYLLKFSDEKLKEYLKFWFMTYYAPNIRVAGEDKPYFVYLKLVDEILNKENLTLKEEESSLFIHGSNDILKNCFINWGGFINYNKDSNTYFVKSEDKDSLLSLKSIIEKNFLIPEDYFSIKEFFERYSEENFKLFYSKFKNIKRNLTAKDLGQILKDRYSNSIENGKVASIHLFGIEYGLYITENKIKIKEIIEISEISDSYATELSKGIKLSLAGAKYGNGIIKTNGNNKPLNRIVYGAPGTGKSYLLSEEAKESFKDLVIENIIEETEEVDENRSSWVVGAKWGPDDQTKRFIEEGVWENGYSDKYLERVKEVQEGDFIAVKSSFTRKKSDGKFTSVLRTKALGIVKKNYNDGRTLDVEWVDTEERDYDGISYRLTIHEVSEKYLHIFNPICKLNKTVYTEKIEMSTVERVTFYDGYTHGQFVGAYKPFPSEEGITYKYIAGAFMKQLVEAYKNPSDNFCLIIEEINRARADKVFGNIFQLLDRDEEGKSQYPVSLSEEQLLYLQKELGEDDQEILDILLTKGLYIPKNLYIWATMNSADQGVYPLDTAFKRRWSFEHIGLNENEKEMSELKVRLEKDLEIEWNGFRKEINERLLSIKVSEDRLLAPFFVKKEEFKDGILDDKVFIDKVLVYLFDDVLRHKKKGILFKKSINSFSKLKEELGSGKKIFTDEFYDKFESEVKLKSYSQDKLEVEEVATSREPYNNGVE